MTLLNINSGAKLIYQFSDITLITDILVSVLSNVLLHFFLFPENNFEKRCISDSKVYF